MPTPGHLAVLQHNRLLKAALDDIHIRRSEMTICPLRGIAATGVGTAAR
jgi:hypothetical protein